MRTEPSHLCIINLKTTENYVWALPYTKIASRHSLKSHFCFNCYKFLAEIHFIHCLSTQDLAMMFIAHLCVVLAWLISPFSSCPSFALSNQNLSRRWKRKCFSHHVTQCCYPHPIKWEQSSIVQTECFWPFMTLQYVVI